MQRRPSDYYMERSEFVRDRDGYMRYNDRVVVIPGRTSYIYHPQTYVKPLPRRFKPIYITSYRNHYRNHDDYYILGRLLMVLSNAVERRHSSSQINNLANEITYLKRELQIRDSQLIANNRDEFNNLIHELGVPTNEINSYNYADDEVLRWMNQNPNFNQISDVDTRYLPENINDISYQR